MLKVNSKAPDFEAVLDDGTTFRRSGLEGQKNLVLYFYPADFTNGCTAQACSFRDSYAQVQRYDAVIVGVSRDSKDKHAAFRQSNNLEFPLISDPDGAIARLYHVTSLIPRVRPRVTYVIDEQGVIRSAFRHDIFIGRHLRDTLTTLADLKEAGAAQASA